jgi:DNA-directed RNA polymerase I subunit RPA43
MIRCSATVEVSYLPVDKFKIFNLCSGIVNKKSVDHIGCLVHKCFHVSIPRSAEEADEEWLGSALNIGDQVTFTVEVCDFTGSLPYIRGKLIDLR